jgi:hypothetical protein
MLADAGGHVAQVSFGVQAVYPCRSYQAIEDGGALAARVRAGEQIITATKSDFTDILPISVKNWKFTIAGIRFMGVRYAIEIANNAAVGVLSMWTTALAQSRWFPHGCWIPWHA